MTQSEWQGRLEKLLLEYDAAKDIKMFEELVTEGDPISTREEFVRWVSLFPSESCFRGQRKASWDLVATLDRKSWLSYEVKAAGVVVGSYGPLNMLENERRVLLEFQRGAHHYHERTPPILNTVDWLAMMQHYGAPTRLLDWTRSPYVVLYFALREDSSGDSALWAIDLNWLRERSDELLRIHYSDYPTDPDFDALLDYINGAIRSDQNRYPIVVPVTPRQLNQRMTVQQGELLYNLHGWIAFSKTLLGMLLHPTQVERQVVGRVIVRRGQRIKLLEELRRMNIHEASLFPGLDGFARSLGHNLDISLAEQIEEKKREDAKALEAQKKLWDTKEEEL